jgi:hypothetical protein
MRNMIILLGVYIYANQGGGCGRLKMPSEYKRKQAEEGENPWDKCIEKGRGRRESLLGNFELKLSLKRKLFVD